MESTSLGSGAKEILRRQKYFKAIALVVKITRLTGPVTSHLSEDVDAEQGRADFSL